MAKPLLDDELWALVAPLLPPPPPRRKDHPGRKRLDDRRVFTGILFVLKTGIPWEDLPQEMGCGSGMTCWRRLHEWHQAGAWKRIHQVLLDRLRAADQIDWSRAAIDSSSVRAVGGGEKDGTQPHRPRKARKQTPPRHRRPWHSPHRAPDGRKHS